MKIDPTGWPILLIVIFGPVFGVLVLGYVFANPRGPSAFGVIEWILVSLGGVIWLTSVVGFFRGLGDDTWGSGGNAGGP